MEEGLTSLSLRYIDRVEAEGENLKQKKHFAMRFLIRLLIALFVVAGTVFSNLYLLRPNEREEWSMIKEKENAIIPEEEVLNPETNVLVQEMATADNFLDTISVKNPLRVWTMNLHAGTKSEFITVLQQLLNLSTIVRTGSMKEISKMIGNPEEIIRYPCPNPHRQRRLFFEGMHKRVEITGAHILFHEMKPGNTEFLMPFNKTIVYYLSTSQEFGRENPILIKEWYHNIIRLSKDPRCAIVANNLYQFRNLQYFTGVRANYIRSMSLYTNAQWREETVTLPDIALVNGNTHGWFAEQLFNDTNQILESMDVSVRLKYLRDVFTRYKYPELVKFKCIVFMPYTISTMSQFETYNMGIPTFFPSIDYMVKMEGDDFATGMAHGWRIYWKGLPILKPGPFVDKDCKLPDACTNPHDMNATAEERKAWWRFADYYQWKNVIYYDSPQDLAKKLVSTNFSDVARRMREELKVYTEEASMKWRDLLTRILNPMPQNGYQVGSDYYAAMQERWNATREELDESEENAKLACDTYANGPGPNQRPGPEFVEK